MQAILCNVERRDRVVKAFAAACGAPCYNGADKWDGKQIPIIMGNLEGCEDIQKVCRKEGKPYIYIDHGYFTRGYENGVFRFVVNGHHCTDWRDSDRAYPVNKVKPWKKEGKQIIILPPSGKVAEVYKSEAWAATVEARLKNYTTRKIVIKPKGSGDLQEMLKTAHAVVSFGSVADVECAMAGVPVFCSPHSPAVPIGELDLSKIETPRYPDREQWLRSLAAAQWHLSEMKECWRRIHGFIDLCGFTDGGRKLDAPG